MGLNTHLTIIFWESIHYHWKKKKEQKKEAIRWEGKSLYHRYIAAVLFVSRALGN